MWQKCILGKHINNLGWWIFFAVDRSLVQDMFKGNYNECGKNKLIISLNVHCALVKFTWQVTTYGNIGNHENSLKRRMCVGTKWAWPTMLLSGINLLEWILCGDYGDYLTRNHWGKYDYSSLSMWFPTNYYRQTKPHNHGIHKTWLLSSTNTYFSITLIINVINKYLGRVLKILPSSNTHGTFMVTRHLFCAYLWCIFGHYHIQCLQHWLCCFTLNLSPL